MMSNLMTMKKEHKKTVGPRGLRRLQMNSIGDLAMMMSGRTDRGNRRSMTDFLQAVDEIATVLNPKDVGDEIQALNPPTAIAPLAVMSADLLAVPSGASKGDALSPSVMSSDRMEADDSQLLGSKEENSTDESETEIADQAAALQTERERRARNETRGMGGNVSGFSFRNRPPPSPPDIHNPQGFSPRTNKTRSTQPLPKVVRIFPTPFEDPKSSAALERVIHRTLTSKPNRCEPLFTTTIVDPPSNFPKSMTLRTPTKPSPRESAAGPRSPNVLKPPATADSSPVPVAPGTQPSLALVLGGSESVAPSDGGVAISVGRQKSVSMSPRGSVFNLTEVANGGSAELIAEKTPSPTMGKVMRRFSVVPATNRMRRKSTLRRKSVKDMMAELETMEQMEFDDAGDVLAAEQQDASCVPGLDPSATDLGSTMDSGGSDTSSPNREKKRKHGHMKNHARSLHDISLPDVNEDGMGLTELLRSYPQNIHVGGVVERVLSLEKGALSARSTTPHVQTFLRSSACEKILLGFFWHTVVSLRRRRLENDLLREHKAFEDAFYEVNPRSNAHPTVEQAEQLLAESDRAFRDAFVDGNADGVDDHEVTGDEAFVFSTLLGGTALRGEGHKGGPSGAALTFRASDGGDGGAVASGTTLAALVAASGVHPYVMRARLEILRAALDDLMLAQGELEDAVTIEEAAFHTMAVAFGQAFRGTTEAMKHAEPVAKSRRSDKQQPTKPSVTDRDEPHTSARVVSTTALQENAMTNPFERKEAIFSVFPTIAAHVTFFILVKLFPNDYDANVFNKKFRRILMQRFTFWCSGVTLQHVAVGKWPTPIEDEAAYIANVLVSKENVVNGQYAVMKEFHKRANHSAAVFSEWLRQGATAVSPSAPVDGASPETEGPVAVSSLPRIVNTNTSTNKNSSPTAGGIGATAAAAVASQAVKRRRKHQILPTLQSSTKAWYEHGTVRGTLTAERAFEYGTLGAADLKYKREVMRLDKLCTAGAVFPSVPMPTPDGPTALPSNGDHHSSTVVGKTVGVPVTSPFMQHYAMTVLHIELKVVDLAGREAKPMQLTHLSPLDKFSVGLAFSGHAAARVAKADTAVDEINRAEAQHASLAHQQEQESAHTRKLEASRLQYAERVIEYHLSPRNPDFVRDAQQCERLLREALKAPEILIAQSTVQCQHALRSYREIMFTVTQRRHVLHELSIRVACKIRHMQRLRGDVWGAHEMSTIALRGAIASRHPLRGGGGAKSSGLSAILSGDVDVSRMDFDAAVAAAEFPLIGSKLDEVAEKVALHQWREGCVAIRIEEETLFSDMMSEFTRRHARILQRDLSRFPLMRAAYLPFPTRNTHVQMNAEERWEAAVVQSNAAAVKASSLFSRGMGAAQQAAQKLKAATVHFNPAYFSRDSNHVFAKAKREEEMIHVEQLRQRLTAEYDEEHSHLQSELDEFVSATAVGRRGKLVTPPDGAMPNGVDATMQRSYRRQSSSVDDTIRLPVVYQSSNRGAASPSTPADPQTLLRMINVVTPRDTKRPQQSTAGSWSGAASCSMQVRSPRVGLGASTNTSSPRHGLDTSLHAASAIGFTPFISTSMAMDEPPTTDSASTSGLYASQHHLLNVPHPPEPKHRASLISSMVQVMPRSGREARTPVTKSPGPHM